MRIATGQTAATLDRVRARVRRQAASTIDFDENVAPPDSRFAAEIDAAAREQPDWLVRHGYRSWIYGRALAAVDGVTLDPELFYAGCLLHDYGLMTPTPAEDFTIRSADRALRCAEAVGAEPALELADAIVVHTTPGVTIATDGALGFYLQAGAMVDVAGLRAWDVPQPVVSRTLQRHSRTGFTAEIVPMITAEARAVSGGRFALLRRCGFPALIKLAPFEQR